MASIDPWPDRLQGDAWKPTADRITIRPSGSGMALPELPMTPGREVAGTMDLVGPDVDARWLGRRVVAYLGHEKSGGYAGLAVAQVSSLHELPEGVDESTAVAMIGTGRTTVGVLEQARLNADDVVVVTAAAGGMGTLLVQAASNASATVIGLAGSAGKAQVALQQVAKAAVEYPSERAAGAGHVQPRAERAEQKALNVRSSNG